MRFFIKTLLLSTLFSTGWMICHAQSNGSPSQRLKLVLVDNKSTYDIDGERNYYVNKLRLSQSESAYPLTAGMLNDGNNYITFHRNDNLGRDTTFARINLATEMIYQPVFAGQIKFSGDGTNLPSSQTTMTQSMLPANWSTDGTNLILQTDGTAYIAGSGGLTFTVPEGYSNDTLQLVVELGTNLRGGLFCYNLNNGGWYIIKTELTAGQTVIVRTFTGVNSGDVINLCGGIKEDESYYVSSSPDMKMIGFRTIPKSYIPSAIVSPTISYWDGTSWGQETTMDGVSSMNYSVNGLFDLSELGIVTDTFSESTAGNMHPSEYQYNVDFNANIVLPHDGSTGMDFTASADLTSATTSDPSSSSFVGPNNWNFFAATAYTPTAGRCCYLQYYGAVMYIMPESFMGNSVNVTVTSSSGDGAGDLYVNGILHTFEAGETYTWTVPVCANGAIELRGVRTGLSIDFTSIIITSGNAKLSSPNDIIPRIKNDAVSSKGNSFPFATEKKAEGSDIMVTVK